MSSQEVPDIHAMSKSQLHKLKRDAIRRGEKANAYNNFFTIKFDRRPFHQPGSWIPCDIAPLWCDYHGPSRHTSEACKTYHGSQPEAQPDETSHPATPSPSPKPSPKKSKPPKQAQFDMKRYLDLRSQELALTKSMAMNKKRARKMFAVEDASAEAKASKKAKRD